MEGTGNGARRAAWAWVASALALACGHGGREDGGRATGVGGERAGASACGGGSLAGRYWGRWGDVPDGMRVEVWLDGDGRRVRGDWELPPWHGTILGVQEGARVTLDWREEGVIAVRQVRARRVVLTRDARTGALRGGAGEGAVELVRAGFAPPGWRAGLWLARWTGLPAGLAVETVVTRTPEGRWHAAYHYQSREGSFEGDLREDGALEIRWRELSPRDLLARGAGVLRPDGFGLRGTFGVDEQSSGTGSWALEPFGE